MFLLNKVLEDYPHRKKQVGIITHEHNKGLGSARKAGMKAATGEYVISCDSDDWVETDMYEEMYAKAIEEDADIVCCGFWQEYENGKGIKVYEGMVGGKGSVRSTEWDTLHPSVWNKLVRRSLYVDEHIYPLDGVNLWEDRGVTVQLCFLSKRTIFIYKPLYHYNKQNTNSYTSRIRNQFFVQDQIKYARGLDVFFREQGAYERYNLSIQSLKFHAKLLLLHDGLYQEWLHTFPETHRYIWKFPMSPLFRKIFHRQTETVEVFILRKIPLSRKIVYSLAAHGIFFPYELRRWILGLFEIMRVH
jgi:glycosyltransferase involved in cell wall biosynthesis